MGIEIGQFRGAGSADHDTETVNQADVASSTRPKVSQNSPGVLELDTLHLPATSFGTPARSPGEAFSKYAKRWLETTLNPASHPEPRLPRDKLTKMLEGPFALFRGTLPLFEQRVAEKIPELSSPTFGPRLQEFRNTLVPINGDAHPFNFGVTVGPVFGLNDFDEATVSPGTLRPFSYELLRNATGFLLFIEVLDPKKESELKKDVVEAMVEGYTKALEAFAKRPDSAREPITRENAPKGIVRELLKRATRVSRKEWLKERLDSDSGKFLESHLDEERVRQPEAIAPLQQALDDQWLQQTTLQGVRVNDLIRKYNSGTGTADLPRYRLAVTLTDKSGKSRNAILELKRSRPGPHNPSQTPRDSAQRVAEAQEGQLPGGDPLFGYVVAEDGSYTVRELNQHKVEAEAKDLENRDTLEELAWSSGWALAQGHVGYNPAAQRTATPEEIEASAKRLLKAADEGVGGADLEKWLRERADDLEGDFRKVLWPIFEEYAESAIVRV